MSSDVRPGKPTVRHSAIDHAVKVKALEQLAREIGIAEAVGVLAAIDDRTPRELAAAARQGHRASVIAEMARLEQEGKGRAASMILARLNAADPLDPVELATLADKYRRWRRTELRAHARLPSAEFE